MIRRKIKRNILKKELGTNEINDAFHNKYGYKPNVEKQSLLLKLRTAKALRKLKHKKARKNKKEREK